MTLNKNASQFVKSLQKDTGVSEHQAIALIGNGVFESKGLNAAQNEDKPTVAGSLGGTSWMQWTGPRRKQLEVFSARNNLDANSDEAAYKFLVNELNNTDGESAVPSFLHNLKQTKNINEANDLTIKNYLFPGVVNKSGRNASINELQKQVNDTRADPKNDAPLDFTDFTGSKVPETYEPTKDIKQPDFTLEQKQEAFDTAQQDVVGFTDKNAIKLGGESWEQVFTQTGNVGLKSPMNTDSFNDPLRTYGPNTVQAIDTLPHMVKINNEHQIKHPSGYVVPAPAAPEVGLGILSSAFHALKKNSFVGNIAQENSFQNAVKNEDESVAPEGWTWHTDLEPILRDTPRKYWQRFLFAKTPRQRENIINWIHDDIVRNEQYENGSYLGAFAGTIASGLTPELLFPFGAAMKAAKLSKTALHAVIDAAPGVSLSAVSHSALMQSTTVTGNLSDFAYDAFIDTTAGLLFIGGGKAAEQLNAWSFKARKQISYGSDGVTPKFNMDKDGTINAKKPYSAAMAGAEEASSEQNLSSAVVKEADQFYQSAVAKEGLFAWQGPRRMASWISPQFRGLNSENSVVNFIALRSDDTVIKTIGNQEMKANPVNFASRFNFYNDKTNQAAAKLKSLFYEANGMDAGTNNTAAIKRATEKFQNGEAIDWDSYGQEVSLATVTGKNHSNPKINEASQLLFSEQQNTFKKFGEAFNYPTDDAFVKTANQYANIIYDRQEIKKRPNDFRTMSINSMQKRNELIGTHMNPINDLKTEVESLKTLRADRELDVALTPESLLNVNSQIRTKRVLLKIAGTPEEKATLRAELDSLAEQKARKGFFSLEDRDKLNYEIQVAEQSLLIERMNVANLAKSNPDTTMAIENFDGVSGSDSQILEKILEPKNQAKAEHSKNKSQVTRLVNKDSKIKKSIVSLKKKRATVEEAVFTSKDKNKSRFLKKQKEFEDKLSNKKAELDAQIRKAEDDLQKNNLVKTGAETDAESSAKNLSDEERQLNIDIDSGKFNNNLTMWVGDAEQPFAKRVLRNPSNLFKFHKPYAANEMDSISRAYMEAVTGTTDGDITADILGSLTGMPSENPISKRTHMIAHEDLINNKFVDTDPVKMLKIYNGRLNRLISMKEAYGKVEPDGGIRQLLTKFKKVNDVKRNKVASIQNKAKREAASETLEKKIDDDIDYLKSLMNRVLGKSTGTKRMNEFTKSLRHLASYVMLGRVPLTMITDPIFAMFKNGVWPTIKNANRPFLTELSRGVENKEFANFLGLAMEGESNALMSRWVDDINSGDFTKTGVLASGLEKASNLTSKFSLTNALNNLQERVLARTNDSIILQSLEEFKAGTIKDGRLQALLQYGIDPEKMGDRILKSFKKHGDEVNSGLPLWTDKEAQRIMSDAIRSSIRDILIRKDLLTNPFWTDSQLGGLISLFKSWSFSAFARFTVPLMQSPDSDKIIGAILALGVGSLVAPLRRISRGEDAFKDDNSMYVDAVSDGGVASVFAEGINVANSLVGNRLLGGLVGDKFRQQNAMSAIAGPLGSIADSIFGLAGSALQGDISESQRKKSARLIPFIQSWQVQGFTNKLLEK